MDLAINTIVNSQMYSEQLSVDYDDLKPIMQAGGLFERGDMNDTTRFMKFGYLDPYYRVGRTFEYVFFTKPDLYILNSDESLNSGTNLPLFNIARELWKPSLRDLQYRRATNEPFSAILYNHRASNLDLPDLQATEIETGENMWGTKVFYRRASVTSSDNFEFTMEFRDNKFLDTYMFFRLYELYEERKAYGLIPLYNEREYYRYYILNKRLHDQMSVYKFIIGEDGRELIHWSKLYGVYPKSCPRSVFGDMPEDGNFKFTVTFKANFVEDMDPNILIDFNELSRNYYPNGNFPEEVPLYSIDKGFVTNSAARPPYFRWEKSERRSNYKFVMVWGDE